MRWWAGVVVGLALAATGCPAAGFACNDDSQCGRAGVCQPSGYCSFPDPTCTSGQRFGEHSGPLSGQCANEDDAVSTTEASTTNDTADATSIGGATTTDDDPTTDDGTTAGGGPSDPTSSSGPLPDESTGPRVETTGDAGTTTAPPTTSDSGDGGDDPYGRCSRGCAFPGATCLTGQGGQMMCAPSCRTEADPSTECPDPIDPGFTVQCMGIGDGTAWCFVNCEGQSCPGTMDCAPGSVCSYDPA